MYLRYVFIDSAQQITVPDFSLSSGEYFWNTDPGQGNGTSLIAVDGNWDESLESAFKTITSLPPYGYNVFNIRVQDNDGNWGSVFSVTINLQLDTLYGCIDSLAINYDPTATVTDGFTEV